MLRNEAFTADKLDAQLGGRHAALPVGQVAQPLRPALEAARNQQRSSTGTRKTSPRGYKGNSSLEATLGKYAERLSNDPAAQAEIKASGGVDQLPRLRLNLNDR